MQRVLTSALGGALFLALGIPSAMAATPQLGEPVPAPRAGAPVTSEPFPGLSSEKQKVMVLLASQPQGVGDEAAGLSAVEALLAAHPEIVPDRRFGMLVHGFSGWMTTADMAALATDARVASVTPMKQFYPTMQSAAELTQSVQARQRYKVDGSGVVVAVIDTGIDMGHQDMRLDDGVATKLTPAPGFTPKVPYGYNFADRNTTVKDTTKSQHGMHVAGIVAANGGPTADVTTNGRINGIAPNAQLLAMKVFSNNTAYGAGANEDDVIAAIEDSVKHGADIINMSLGSPNGVRQESRGEGRAIANAQKAGVQVLVAAGNEGQQWSPAGAPLTKTGSLDDGTVGSPAVNSGAIAVASVNNSSMVAPTANATLSPSGTRSMPYQIQVGTIDGKAHTIVNCGLGRVPKGTETADDFPAEVKAALKGNYALIERGGNSFSDKFANAQAAGAVGVIIYNSADGGEQFQGMGGIDKSTIPGYFLMRSDGVALVEALKQGPASVTFTEVRQVLKNKDPLRPSDFSSWGTAGDLSFKPQLAGIGGSVYSTLNDNRYETESGTSMATPHVAGVTALGLAEYAKRYAGLSAVDRDTLWRQAMSNTAKILTHDANIPFAPRQMGAGLVQTKDALDTHVYVTVDNEPTVALKQVNGPRTFTATLTNKGTTAATFTVGGTCVVEETRDATGRDITACSATEKFTAAADTVTVPAQGSATVAFTLAPDTSRDHWTQGWATFASTEAGQPSLSLPYLGFVGDWNKEPIIDVPRSQGTPVLDKLMGAEQKNLTQLWGSYLGMSPLSRVGDYAWISPNGDGFYDKVLPSAMLLRSAKTLNYQILDSQGTVIRDLGNDQDVARSTFAKMPTSVDSAAHMATSRQWDATVYNPATDSFVPVPDGKYTYRVRAQLAEDMPWQVVDMGFGIDRVAPTVKITTSAPGADDKVTVTFSVSDDASGFDANAMIVYNDRMTKQWTPRSGLTKVDDHTYTLSIYPDDYRYLDVRVPDRAGNKTRIAYSMDAQVSFTRTDLKRSVDKDSQAWADDKPVIHDGLITLTGAVSPRVAKATLNGVEVKLVEGQFTADLPVQEGRNDFLLIGYDAAGAEVARDTSYVTYDNAAPVITITDAVPARDAQGRYVLDANGKVTVSGTVTDNLAKPGDPNLPLMVWLEDGTPVTVAADGKFTATLTPKPEQQFVTINATDYFSGVSFLHVSSTQLMLARPATTQATLSLVFDDYRLNAAPVDPSDSSAIPVLFGDENVFLDRTFTDLDTTGAAPVFHLKGHFTAVPGKVVINGKPVAVSSDLRINVPVEIHEGLTNVPYEIFDAQGKLVVSSAWRYFYDKSLPSHQLDKPTIAEDGALYVKAPNSAVEVGGSVSDNAFGYTVWLNGHVLKEVTNVWDPGANQNKGTFAGSITAKDGEFMRLAIYDAAGNGLERHIPIVVDAVAPKLGIEGVSEGKTIAPTQKITVTGTDPHLRSLTVLVDGKQVEAKVTTVAPAPGARVDVINPNDPSKPRYTSMATPVAAPLDATTLVVEVPAQGSGRHTLSVTAADRAGNLTTQAVAYAVDAQPSIGGPDAVTLDPDKGPLLDQLRALLPVTDDLDASLAVTADLSGLLLDQTVPVTVTVTDSAGHVVTKVVQVTYQRPLRTIQGSCADVTGRFVAGDTVKVECRTDAAGNTVVALSTTVAAMDATITAHAGGNVYLLGEDGKPMARVESQSATAGVSFAGKTDRSYLIGTVGTAGQLPPPASQGGEGPGFSKSLDAQDLSDTGVPALALLALGLGLAALMTGSVVVARKK